ncbi:MAG: hypothetical protein ACJ735_03660 [Actinomycetes bacterium]
MREIPFLQYNLGEVALDLGDEAAAREHLREAIDGGRQVGYLLPYAAALRLLAGIETDPEVRAALADELKRLISRIGADHDIAVRMAGAYREVTGTIAPPSPPQG